MAKKKIFFVLAIIIILFTSLLIEKDTINKILYPRMYSEYVEIYSKEFGLDENLVYSVIKVESKFRKDAVSHKGAKGLMQISDITREWAKEELRKLGFVFPDAKANFIFARHPEVDANELFQALKENNIFVRHWNAPRIDQYLRITIGTREEMETLFDFLRTYIKEK
mgnify:CR=1 FL=1